jgi:hypothetical protein
MAALHSLYEDLYRLADKDKKTVLNVVVVFKILCHFGIIAKSKGMTHD